tara:strand:+ start:66 stop:374 length:309 start_codon:yes stop_codon:yes gene_type:complete
MPQYEKAFQGFFSLMPTKEKKHEKSPDMSGSVDFPLEEAMKLADWLVAQPGEQDWKGDTVIRVPIVGWHKESKKNPDFKFIGGTCSALKQEKTSESEVPPPF